MHKELPPDFIKLLNSVTKKRAKFVIDTILKNGYCSTEDLKKAGYEHAPRAARDVRELGIPLDTFSGKDSEGKQMAIYKFGDWEEAKKKNSLSKTAGRTQLTNKLKTKLIERYGAKCNLYSEEYPERLLQPDHRIPYEIGGDPDDMMDTDYFMLLCPSANRDKSWSCENCVNWKMKDIDFCRKCYYAFPENYSHVAGEEERRLDIIFKNEEIEIYNKIKAKSETENKDKQKFIKQILSLIK